MPETTIHLPQPCQENWAAMTPTATGRHCASCRETVVDFTCMSEAAVVTFLRQHPSVSCGRFRESQLDRPLLAPAQAVGGWRRWWGATLALLGLGALGGPQARGQAASPAYWGGPVPAGAIMPGTSRSVVSSENKAIETPIPAAEQATGRADSMVSIRGVVYNRWGLHLAGAKIRLPGAGVSAVTTDERGRFEMLVPRAMLDEEAVLRIRYANYDKKQYLATAVAVDVRRIRPYRIRLTKQERVLMGAPRFR